MIEVPLWLAIRKNGAEQAARARPAQEMLLVGRFVVGIAGRKHHAFHAERHHVVEESAHAVGVGAVEERGVGGDAEAALHRFANALDRDIVPAFLADGEIVMFALAVHVNGESQIFARLEKVEFFL